MLLSILIPVYNNRSDVFEAVHEIARIDTFPLEREIIVVCENASEDLLDNLSGEAARITRFYSCPADAGKGMAIRIGLCVARGDVILFQDADIKPDANEYHELLAPIVTDETSVVFGSRFLQRTKGIESVRRFANLILTKTSNFILGTNLTDVATPYKLITSEVSEALILRSNSFEIEQEITAKIIQAGYEIVEVPVNYRPRQTMKSTERSWQDGVRSLRKIFQCRLKTSAQKL
jgi:glycosyltransferase involved in cell wall biosynthesis